jgi:peptide/nickel transport system substrate-binding protein
MGPEITPTAKPKRSRRIVAIIVAVIVIAAIAAVLVIFYTGTGTVLVQTSQTVVPADTPLNFTAQVSTPALVSTSTVSWQFGDGVNASGPSAASAHTYAFPGTYFVYANAALTNGKTADNSQSLIQIKVVPPNVVTPLGSKAAYGVIAINSNISSAGAPTIAAGGKIAIQASIQQEPTFSSGTNTWQVTQTVVNWGDGSAPITNTTADPFLSPINATALNHDYTTTGLHALTLSVTTQNYSGSAPVGGASNTITTTVGQTIAVGSYAIPTYALQNAGTIINMEAEVGGYFTLDPALDYESVGFEIIANTYGTLLAYNGTRTDSFVPMIADAMPTWTPDFLNYTFHIRAGVKYSPWAGHPADTVSPWDVKYSITRTMIMDNGAPFPPGWIISQFLVPGTFTPSPIDPATFAAINNAISVDNATSSVTFHLQVPAPPLLFEQVIADPLGGGIIDHLWLESTGPKLVWTLSGFNAYEPLAVETNYINAWRNGAVGTGPFMVQYVNNPNDVVLVPNPNFAPLTGIPAADSSVKKVVLEYVQSDSTRELSLQSGAVDIAGIPSKDFNVVKTMVSKSLVQTQFLATLNLFWWNYNFDVYSPGGTNLYGNTIPTNFFVDINVRKAFFHAFDFGQYINTFLGNGIYGVTFGQTYNGIVPKGMIGYEDLSAYNTFDMTLARQFWANSTWFKANPTTNVVLAINVESADSVDQLATQAWKTNLESLDPGHLTINVVPTPFHDLIHNSVPWGDPMAIYFLGWLPDYPFPTDYTLPMLLPSSGAVGNGTLANGGTYPNANNLDIPLFQADPTGTNQVTNLTLMRNLILDSLVTNDVNRIVTDSQQAQRIGANLTIYVPAFQQFAFFVYRTWISGMSQETNPTLGGADLLYNLLTKGVGTSTTSLSISKVASDASLVAMFALNPLTLAAVLGASARMEARKKK